MKGFDYLEFKQSINNLKKQNLENDEKKLFQTAFALAKTMNVSKENLLQSATHYLKVLENENINFNDSLENNAKVKLQEKTGKLNKLSETLEKEKEQLKKLQEKIANHEQQINNLKKELSQSSEKVKSIKMGFETALEEIASQINNDINKIKNYIN
ncbi:MAG TPA: hypothetical protein ENK75_03975 [Saprospiraceae bacterium]|nr:hypothetical protein [Saprospiraceae bacterium]